MKKQMKYKGGRKMKTAVVLTLVLCFFTLFNASAQAFDSGSTGALGAFNPTNNIEVQLPENGILNYTTVNIPSGVTVTFKKNTSNTPVYILATGDVTVAGTINLNGIAGNILTPGKGGTGGFDGGVGAAVASCGGRGLGPGGGNPGTFGTSYGYGSGGGGGGFSANGANGGQIGSGEYTRGGGGGQTYGNANNFPLIGGSGGGGGCGSNSYIGGSGGGGGGAILIASSGTINVTGSITANGGAGASYGWCCWTYNGGGGGGSAGAIRLVADVIKGEGTISANVGIGGTGGYSSYANGGTGGAGRIRIEANTLLRGSNTSPPYTFYAHPVAVFPAVPPSLKITKVGGINVPAIATGAYSTPDIVLPVGAVNPMDVLVEAANIPIGTIVTVVATPEYGSPVTVTATLSGTDASSTATAQVTLSKKSISILMATATFTLQTASNQMPFYAGGEKVEKIKVTTILGGKSFITYITESGKEVPADA